VQPSGSFFVRLRLLALSRLKGGMSSWASPPLCKHQLQPRARGSARRGE
jgi:hypothetical protein